MPVSVRTVVVSPTLVQVPCGACAPAFKGAARQSKASEAADTRRFMESLRKNFRKLPWPAARIKSGGLFAPSDGHRFDQREDRRSRLQRQPFQRTARDARNKAGVPDGELDIGVDAIGPD